MIEPLILIDQLKRISNSRLTSTRSLYMKRCRALSVITRECGGQPGVGRSSYRAPSPRKHCNFASIIRSRCSCLESPRAPTMLIFSFFLKV